MPRNESRMNAASEAIKTHAQAKDHKNVAGWPPCQEEIVDLLTDLRFYCHGGACSFDDAVRISQYHYMEERKGGE